MILYFFLILLSIILFTTLFAALSAAPWLPTKRKDVGRAIQLAQLKNGDVVYDLGCGDGRLLIAAKKINKNIKIIGVEISVLFYLITKLNFWLHRMRGRVILKDLFKIDLQPADVVFIYLMPKSYPRLVKKLELELKPGARVVVGVWPIDEWQSRLVREDKPDNSSLSLFVYRMR